MSDRNEPSREDRVGEAVAWYYEQAEAGRPPDPAGFLARFPDLQSDLASFLADKAAFDRAAGPAPTDPDATVPPADRPPLRSPPPFPLADPDVTLAPADTRTGRPGDPNGPELAVGMTASGRHFGDYEILHEIARGGMGVVLRARHVSLHREVALKMILTGPLASAADVARFRAEAEAAANLDHPNVLPIFEVGEHLGQQYFAMKFVPGGSLAGKIAELVKDPKAAAAVFSKVCRAVDFAHRRGILHRDLKPGNVLLDADGTPYVTDFGLAKKVDGDSGLTQSGAIVGTPSYMAPEQARAEKQLTTGADVYALGAILYELLTGRPPFRGGTILDTILQVLEKAPTDPRTVNPKADRDLAVIALKCLEKDPTKRYTSAAGLADDVDRWQRGEPILARPVGRLERGRRWCRRNPTVAALLVLAGAALVGGTGLSLFFAVQAADRAEKEGEARRQAEEELRRAATARYAFQLALAQHDLREGRVGNARATLEATDPTLRRWEFDHLWSLCCRMMATLNREPVIAFSVAFTRDGKHLLAPSGNLDVHLYEVATGAIVRTFAGHSAQVRKAFFSPDGKRVASVTGVDFAFVAVEPVRELKIWDADTGQALHGLSGVYDVAFSPDGQTVAVPDGDQAVLLYRAADGTAAGALRGHEGRVTSVSYSPDGQRLASSDTHGRVILWDTGSGKPAHVIAAHALDQVACVRFSPGGGLLATAGCNGQVAKVWDADTGALLFTLPGHNSLILDVSFSPDGRQLVTTSWDNALRTWDLATGALLFTRRGHSNFVHAVTHSPDGRRLASSSVDGTLRLWDLTAADALSLRVSAHYVCALAIDPDGRRLAAGGGDVGDAYQSNGYFRIWDLRHPAPPLEVRTGDGLNTRSLAYSPDGTYLASVSGERERKTREFVGSQVRLRAAATGEDLAVLGGHDSFVWELAFAPDGRTVGSASEDGTIGLFDVARQGSPRKLRGHSGPVRSVAFRADGRTLASASTDRMVRLWDVADGRLLRTLTGHDGPVNRVAFSPDGALVASAADDRTVKVWDVDAGTEVTTLRGHALAVWGLAFTPDGSRLATGSHDKTVKLWDLSTWQEVFTLEGHPREVHGVVFNRDGTLLASSSHDGTVRLWPGTPTAPRSGFLPADGANEKSPDGREVRVFHGHTGVIRQIAFAPNGRSLASCAGWPGSENDVRMWDLETGTEQRSLDTGGAVAGLAFSPDGRHLLGGGYEGLVRIWRFETGALQGQFSGHTEGVEGLAFGPDGSTAFSGSLDGTVRQWDVRTGRQLKQFGGGEGRVLRIAVSAAGDRLLSVGQGPAGVPRVWDVATGKEVCRFTGHAGEAEWVAVSPDGRQAASCDRQRGPVLIWNPETGQLIRRLIGHKGGVNCVAFSPDGKWLASASLDGTARLWDVQSGKEVECYRGHRSLVWCVAFSPDGRRLASGGGGAVVKGQFQGGGDRTIRVWELPKP